MSKKLIHLISFVLVLCLTTTVANADITTDLVGHWPLDGDATDASGNGYDGTLVGEPQWVAGQIAGALYFDGDGDAVDLGNADVFNFTGSFSISAWANIEAWNGSGWHCPSRWNIGLFAHSGTSSSR